MDYSIDFVSFYYYFDNIRMNLMYVKFSIQQSLGLYFDQETYTMCRRDEIDVGIYKLNQGNYFEDEFIGYCVIYYLRY